MREGHLHDLPRLTVAQFEKRAQVSDLTIRHELQVMDVKGAFVKAVALSVNLRLAEFSTWPFLNQFPTKLPSGAEIMVKPDDFLQLQEVSGKWTEHSLYVEVDRSTETLEKLASKAQCYASYYRSGGFAVRNGNSAENFRSHPFRVLFVLKTAQRRDNIAARLRLTSPPILTQVWLTTLEEVLTDPMGAIWTRPLDYERVAPATSMAIGPRADFDGYLTSVRRDAGPQERLCKHRLL